MGRHSKFPRSRVIHTILLFVICKRLIYLYHHHLDLTFSFQFVHITAVFVCLNELLMHNPWTTTFPPPSSSLPPPLPRVICLCAPTTRVLLFRCVHWCVCAREIAMCELSNLVSYCSPVASLIFKFAWTPPQLQFHRSHTLLPIRFLTVSHV